MITFFNICEQNFHCQRYNAFAEGAGMISRNSNLRLRGKEPHPIGGLPHSLWEINLPPSQPTLSYRVGSRGRGNSGIAESPQHNGEGQPWLYDNDNADAA